MMVLSKKDLYFFLLLTIPFTIMFLFFAANPGSIIDDEGILANASWLVGLGLKPYKEFLYTNLPIPLYLSGILIRIFGRHLFLLRFLNYIFTLLTAFSFYSIAKLCLKSVFAGIILILLYFNISIFAYSGHFLHEPIAWGIALFLIYTSIRNENSLYIGLLSSTLIFTKQTAIPFLLLIFFLNLKNKPDRFLFGFLLGFTLFFFLWGKQSLINAYLNRWTIGPLFLSNLSNFIKYWLKKKNIIFTLTLPIILVFNFSKVKKTFFVLFFISLFFLIPLLKSQAVSTYRHFFFLYHFYYLILIISLKYFPKKFSFLLAIFLILFLVLQSKGFIKLWETKTHIKKMEDFVKNFILQHTKPDDYILTDYSGFSFLTGRMTPPLLANLSYTIPPAYGIDSNFIIKRIKKFNIKLILIHTKGKARSPHHIVKIEDYNLLKNWMLKNYLYLGELTNGDIVFDVYKKP